MTGFAITLRDQINSVLCLASPTKALNILVVKEDAKQNSNILFKFDLILGLSELCCFVSRHPTSPRFLQLT